MSMQTTVIGSKFVCFEKESKYYERVFKNFPVNPYDKETPITVLQVQFDAKERCFLVEFVEK